MSKKITVTVAGLVTALAVTACGGGHSNHHPSASSTAKHTSAASSLPPAKVPLNVPNQVAARKNVKLTTCSSGTNWSAGGTAVNNTGQPVNYLVTVFYTSTGGSVVGMDQVTVGVDAHKQHDWKTTKSKRPAAAVQCVLRGVAIKG